MIRSPLSAAALRLAALALAAPAAAAEGGAIRGGEHDGFTRIVLTVDPTTEWSLETVDGRATLRFPGRQLAFVTDGVYDKIPRTRVEAVSVTPDPSGTLVTVELACDCRVSTSFVGAQYLALDVADRDATPPPAPPPPAETPEARAAREAKAVAARKEGGGFGPPGGMFGKPPDLRTFVAKRTESIEAQLDGKSKGYVPRFGFGPPIGKGNEPIVNDKTIHDVVKAPAEFEAGLRREPSRRGDDRDLDAAERRRPVEVGKSRFRRDHLQARIGRQPAGHHLGGQADRAHDPHANGTIHGKLLRLRA